MTAPRAKGFGFRVLASAPEGHARAAVLTTPHAEVETPTFMPVGTQGSVKGLTAEDVASTGAKIMLGNTYHLWLRPGPDIVASLGGLHGFTRWPHAMLTDSGGFQAFSLGGNVPRPAPEGGLAKPQSLVTLDEEGFTFRSHLDGTRHHLSPEVAVRVQGAIGADIQMQLDVCPPGESPRAVVEAAVSRTTRWARRALATTRPEGQALFGIVQGACFADLRRAHAEELAALDPSFDGLALGGFSVGEPIPRMYETLHEVAHALDPERPRYLMGVGTPQDLLEAIDAGVDMFDCVLPTRNARNAQVFTWSGKQLKLRNAKFREDFSPIDPTCRCYTCASGFTRAYLRHLFSVDEITALTLATIHNLTFCQDFMKKIRAAIRAGNLAGFAAEWRSLAHA